MGSFVDSSMSVYFGLCVLVRQWVNLLGVYTSEVTDCTHKCNLPMFPSSLMPPDLKNRSPHQVHASRVNEAAD